MKMLIAEMIRAGLVNDASRSHARGGRVVEAWRLRITDAGRRALAED
jgi:hypothetical protein